MKKAVVIGASSGIGKSISRILAENSFNVCITGRRKDLLLQLKDERPGSFSVYNFDVCDLERTIKVLDEIASEPGGIDLIVLSSGTGFINEPLDFSMEEQTIRTNVLGFTNIADWAYLYFVRRGSGHFAAITSVAGIRGSRYAPAYNASKSFQIKYLEALRQKAAKSKLPVYITDIRPGFVDTAMAQSDLVFWVSTTEKAGKQIFNAIKRRSKVVYITRRWRLVAAVYKIIPGFILEKL